jgi:two-component system cell cycle sensor histidine kinase/response regulator CckA
MSGRDGHRPQPAHEPTPSIADRMETQRLASLGAITRNIGHELNNFLAVIVGNAGLLRMDAVDDSPVATMLDQIQTAARGAAQLIQEMARFADGDGEDVELVDLSSTVETMTSLLDAIVAAGGKVEHQLAPDLPQIRGYGRQLQYVVLCLVSEASTALHGLPGLITVTTSAADADGHPPRNPSNDGPAPVAPHVSLEVTAANTGAAAPTSASAIRSSFTADATAPGSTLSTAIAIVDAHHGTITVDGDAVRGTSVRVVLPAAASVRGGRVLVVDDEAPVRALLAKILQANSFEVLDVGDGAEAVELCRSRDDVEVMLLDLTMPGLSGEETLRTMTAIRPHLEVIIMTGYPRSEAERRLAGHPFEGFLHKPFTTGEVLAEVQAACGRGRSRSGQAGRARRAEAVTPEM